MIKVISQNTSERNEETRQLFEQIKPLLDEGYSYMTACVMVGRCKGGLKNSSYNFGWFKDLKAYGETQGYPYHKHKGRRKKPCTSST